MRYENKQAPEGINVTRQNPLLALLKLLTGAVIVIVLVVVLVNVFASKLGRSVPFRYEQALMQHVDLELSGNAYSIEMQSYLTDLSERLLPFLDVPDEISLQIHHNADDVFNAFATLAGNLVFYSGLLEKLPHENALAMVMAHEISHVLHRDPAAGLGGGLATMMALMALTGSTGSGTLGKLMNQTGSLTQMKFTRDMERAADRAALAAVAGLYGHVAGADDLFRVMQTAATARQDDDFGLPGWLEVFASTHPLSTQRIESIAATANENDWVRQGTLTPLPDDFANWLKASADQ